MNILVAEDDPLQLAMLRAALQGWGHTVTSATDGEAAWEHLLTGAFPIVVSDWHMPRLSGINLCRRVREAGLSTYTYFVLLTAAEHPDAVVEGMDAGADDFVAKPFRRAELRARIRAGERIIELEAGLAARTREVEAAYATIQRDLDAAAALQRRSILHERRDEGGVRVAGCFRPARVLAGDLFNAVRLDAEHLGVYLLDVAGKGVAAAMLAMAVSKALHDEVASPLRDSRGGPRAPAEALALLNARFQSDADEYLTMVYALVHLPTGAVRLAQAGHPPPVLLSSGGEMRWLGDGGFPVGLLPDAVFDEVRFDLGVGDRLLLYSDGIPDAVRQTAPGQDARDRESGAESFGADRLGAIFSAARQSSLEGALHAVDDAIAQWQGDAPPEDDVSMLALERMPR